MFTNNPFAALTDFLPPLVMQVYIVLMILAVVIGTLFDVYHKGSAKFFARRKGEIKGCRAEGSLAAARPSHSRSRPLQRLRFPASSANGRGGFLIC